MTAIRDLSPKYQYEGKHTFSINRVEPNFSSAIAAYMASLRLAFMSAALFFLIALAILIPIKLPNLLKEKVTANTKDDPSNSEDDPQPTSP